MSCKTAAPDGTPSPTTTEPAAPRVARAEALGRLRAFDPWLLSALGDPAAVVRHAAARALGTVDAPEATSALAAALASSDAELVRLAAAGLGVSFRTLEKPACDALSVALLRVPDERVVAAVSRALGSCDPDTAEPMLRQRLATHEEAAVAGLARLARSRKKLQTATMSALIDRALDAGAPSCLEPLARVPWPEELVARVAAAALPPSVTSARIYAGLGARGRPALAALALQTEPTLEARAAHYEALRGLAKQGQEAPFARLLAPPEGAPVDWANGPQGATLANELSLAPDLVRSPELRAVLTQLAALPGTSPRLDTIRCAAASRVAGSAFDSAPMIHCAAEGTLAFELARLRVLVRSPLRGGRQPHFEALLQSAQVRVREAAIEALAEHPEAISEGWALALVNRALGSERAGEVIAALEVVSKLPENAALSGYATAAKRSWPDDSAELFEALLTVGRARHLAEGVELAGRLTCHAAQPVRRLARQLVPDARACAALTGLFPPVPEAGATKITLHATAGALVLHLDPKAAKTSVAEIVALATAGFYAHTEMHRVVPGFVVQFGDPGADGYGGGGGLLQHETSEGAFGPLRIGIAHAGFDTGSSQLFVTTGPARHLDGDYTWLGVAEGPWADVVQGDLVTAVEIAQE